MHQGYERIGRSVTLQAAKRQCLDKVRYGSRNIARDAAARKANKHPDWEPLRPYGCTICKGFHLTTQAKPLPRIETRPHPQQNSNQHARPSTKEFPVKQKPPMKPAKKPGKPGKKPCVNPT